MEKTIEGCAWCERTDVELGVCCLRHVRLVCPDCRQGTPFAHEHEPVSESA